jgi:hypothetical protein
MGNGLKTNREHIYKLLKKLLFILKITNMTTGIFSVISGQFIAVLIIENTAHRNTLTKADNLAAICELIAWKMWEPRRLTTLWVSMACYRDSCTFSNATILNRFDVFSLVEV